METTETIDVAKEVGTETFRPGDVLKAERRGANTLILYKLSGKVQRFDGKKGVLLLVHRWHLNENADIHAVQGEDRTIWTHKELGDWEHKSLFDLVSLIG